MFRSCENHFMQRLTGFIFGIESTNTSFRDRLNKEV